MNRKNKAQAMGEYTVLITLLVVSIASMSLFVKRLLQARVKDAQTGVMTNVKGAYADYRRDVLARCQPPACDPAEIHIPTAVADNYEPYYTEQTSNVSRSTQDTIRLYGRGGPGISEKTYNEITTVETESTQLPPGAY